MKWIIAGGRDFEDYEFMKVELGKHRTKISEVVSGMARGADRLGLTWAAWQGLPIKQFYPDYKRFGSKQAPLTRNCDMADYADGLIAFWDGKSTGTAHMIQQARKRNLLVIVIKY